MSTVDSTLRTTAPEPETVATWGLILTTEFLLVIGYLLVTPTTSIVRPRYVVYPFVWINVGVGAAAAVSVSPQNRRHRAVGAVIAVAYYLALLYTAGNLWMEPLAPGWTAELSMAVPGWGPLVTITGPGFSFAPIPFEAIGYAGLAYLLYANVLRISRSALAGVLGLVSCVGCTVPIVAPALGVLGGPVASLASTATQHSYDLGTAIFVFTVAILYASAAGAVPTVKILSGGERS
ncbi:MAG: hypothetical protein ABEJ77_00470 [Halanaeroarchaeum sp.]